MEVNISFLVVVLFVLDKVRTVVVDKRVFVGLGGLELRAVSRVSVRERTSLRECRRMCRLVHECRSFNMIWESRQSPAADTALGTCELMDAVNRTGLTSNVHAQHFWTCPFGMTTSVSGDACYARVNKFRSWERAVDFCSREIHPDAYITDILSDGERRELGQIMDDLSMMWVGARAVGGRFVWAGSGQPLTYTNWKAPSSARAAARGDCLMSYKGAGDWGWVRDTCDTKLARFVCKF